MDQDRAVLKSPPLTTASQPASSLAQQPEQRMEGTGSSPRVMLSPQLCCGMSREPERARCPEPLDPHVGGRGWLLMGMAFL